VDPVLEITAALIVTAVTIKLNRVARPFALGAAILAAFLRRTGTARVFTLLSVIVGHESLQIFIA
jgi:hypothetical protein